MFGVISANGNGAGRRALAGPPPPRSPPAGAGERREASGGAERSALTARRGPAEAPPNFGAPGPGGRPPAAGRCGDKSVGSAGPVRVD